MAEETVKKVGKLVIVEDEESLRTMYATRFKQSGYEVQEASNGADGLKLIRETKPDLVLLDILMPKVSGFDVLRELKADKDPAVSSIPVIFLTNLAEDAGFKQGQELGAAGYVMKVNRTPDETVHYVNAVIGATKKASS